MEWTPKQKAAKKPMPKKKKANEKNTGKILIMDDDPSVQEVLGFMLTDLGYKVTKTSDGKEAIQAYKNASRQNKTFDLVLMDLTIPGGMGGKETIQQLKKFDPTVKAIVSSGYSDDPIISHHQKFGFCGVLSKPYEMRDLDQIVKKALGKAI